MRQVAIKRFYRFLFGLMVLSLNVSCLKEDEKSVSPQAAITSFTVGYYNVKSHVINWLGRDTVITSREGGVMYPMTIDQLTNRIYNIDSLAYGSVINAVTSSVYGTGTITYRYADDPESAYYWSMYDSIDFTRELLFSVTSTDGSYTRTYNVNVNVRKVFPDSLLWSNSECSDFPVLSGISAVVRNDTLFCFGTDDSGNPSLTYMSPMTGMWNGINHMTGLPSDGWQHKVTMCGGLFYSVSEGNLYRSADGMSWSLARTDVSGIFLSGNDDGRLWAVSNDTVFMGSSDMSGWTALQCVPEHFPVTGATVFSYPLSTNASITRFVFVGHEETSPYASVWTMLSVDSVLTETDLPSRTDIRLPGWSDISVIRYDGSLFCLGRGLEGFRQSCDNGATWFYCDPYADEDSSWNWYMQLPDGLKGSSCGFACVTDSKGYIWIMTDDGQVWNGAITRLKRR